MAYYLPIRLTTYNRCTDILKKMNDSAINIENKWLVSI